ncbi:MAG TPA: outer-membrane lipoprotein carrier protein LolA [Reyranella sp.]|nr:outer-membrane lipoprotein carrier protein LolA [Reyranella sp.]
MKQPQSTFISPTMRTLFAAALSALVLLVASLPAQAQIGVPEIERYINSMRTLKARFVQSNPNGGIAQGTLYVRRPGRMRFEYDPPSQLKIVADGFQVTMWDNATKDFGQWPIGWTAASFLVKDPLTLSGDLRVEKLDRVKGLLEMTVIQTKKPQDGRVIVRFSENPMALRGWTVIDQRGSQVTVSLADVQTGMQLADSLFKNESGR